MGKRAYATEIKSKKAAPEENNESRRGAMAMTPSTKRHDVSLP
jgi:hypothetical protein